MTAAPVIDIPGLEDDDDAYSAESNHRRRTMGSDESGESGEYKDAIDHQYIDTRHIEDSDITRRGSDGSTDETAIFDAYARQSRSGSTSEDDSLSVSRSPSPDHTGESESLEHHNYSCEDPSPGGGGISLPPLPKMGSHGHDWFRSIDGDGEKTPTQESVVNPLAQGIRERWRKSPPTPLVLEDPVPIQMDRRSTSPTTPKRQGPEPSQVQQQYELPPGMAPPVTRSAVPPGIASQQQQIQRQPSTSDLSQTSLDRPGLARTESGASSTSSYREKEKESVKEKEKEKKGGFFSKKDKKDKDKKGKEKDGFLGSLFGSSKKKVEEPVSVSNFSSAGPAAAAALLGSSKSAKSMGLSPIPSPTSPGFSNFSRYPIHVERAVYRLSHIKLANARRPLYEQVLISNLMFWYLGIIGRNVAEEKEKDKKPEPATSGVRKEEEKEPSVKVVAKGTPPKPIDSGSAGKALPRVQPEPVVSQRKTGLTKPDRSRGSNAEMGVRMPSYGMQNAQVDSEMRNMGMGRAVGPRGPGISPVQGYPPQQLPTQSSQHPHQAQQYQGHPGGPGGMPQRSSSGPLPYQQGLQPGQSQYTQQVQSPQQMQHSQQLPSPQQGYPRTQSHHQLPHIHPQHPQQPPQAQHQHHAQNQNQIQNQNPPPQSVNQPPPQYLQQPQRSLSTPPPQGRALPPSTNNPQSQFRPSSDAYPQQRNPQQHPGIIPPPPRAAPQSSFGPPPPINTNAPTITQPHTNPNFGQSPPHQFPHSSSQSSAQSQQMDPRSRTMSNPHPGPPTNQPNQGMRRVVTEGRPPPNINGQISSPTKLHPGPQPGQIFNYPSGPTSPNRGPTSPPLHHGIQPGQIFNPTLGGSSPSPGQIFTHPQYSNRPPPMLGPGIAPGGQRLPPGAAPPGPPQGDYSGAPVSQIRRPGPGPGPDGHIRPNPNLGGYPNQGGQGRPPQPGQVYPMGNGVQRQGSNGSNGEEFRRQGVVGGGSVQGGQGFAGHHR